MGVSSSVLRSLSAAAQGSAYLLTQRSWTSRIGTGFRKCNFSRPCRFGDHQAGLLEQLQMLHHTEAAHREAFLQGPQGLAVLPEELVEQAPAGGVGERSEHGVHGSHDT